jgi:hypothetical protein
LHIFNNCDTAANYCSHSDKSALTYNFDSYVDVIGSNNNHPSGKNYFYVDKIEAYHLKMGEKNSGLKK